MASTKNLVVKDNILTNASYRLGLIEQRLLLLAVVAIRQTGQKVTPSTKVSLHADDYINQFGVSRQVAYQALKDGCNGIWGREYSYKEITEQGEKIVRSRWVSQIAYIDNTATVELYFTPDVLSKITELERHFTQYELEIVAKLNSKHAVRLYEIIIAWKAKGKTNLINIDDLRDMLGLLPNEYTEIHNFKARVLDKSINEINEKTDIQVKYKQHKQGRKIIGFSFSIQVAKQANFKMTEKQRLAFANQLARLSELSEFAPAGANYDEYAKKIAQELQNKERLQFYKPYLEKIGFKF